MKIRLLTILLLGPLLCPLAAPTPGSTFLDRLCQLLGSRGWSEAELEALRAEPGDWAQADATDARPVALALLANRAAGGDLPGRAQADLAQALGATVKELRRYGIGDQAAARFAIQTAAAVRDGFSPAPGTDLRPQIDRQVWENAAKQLGIPLRNLTRPELVAIPGGRPDPSSPGGRGPGPGLGLAGPPGTRPGPR
jgi:hypothetical protein